MAAALEDTESSVGADVSLPLYGDQVVEACHDLLGEIEDVEDGGEDWFGLPSYEWMEQYTSRGQPSGTDYSELNARDYLYSKDPRVCFVFWHLFSKTLTARYYRICRERVCIRVYCGRRCYVYTRADRPFFDCVFDEVVEMIEERIEKLRMEDEEEERFAERVRMREEEERAARV